MSRNWVFISANAALLLLYPFAWTAPLARAGVLPFFSGTELSIYSAFLDLWASDVALALIVALFAVIAPYLKTILLLSIHVGRAAPERWLGVVETLGRLSMADIFLIALYIVATKGVGVGYVETAWGLWFFTALVLGSMALAWAEKKRAASW